MGSRRRCAARVDHPAPRLALAHGGVEARHVPAGSDFCHEVGDQIGISGVNCEVAQFAGIRFQIKQLRRVDLAVDELEAAVADGDQRRIGAFGGVFHEHRRVALFAARQWQQRLPVGPGRDSGEVDAGEVAQRRQHVEIGGRFGDQARRQAPARDHQGTRAEPS